MSKLDTIVNVNDIELESCNVWLRDRIELFMPPEGVTLREVLHADACVSDRIWVLTHCGSLSGSDVAMLAAAATERALLSAAVTDERCWDAVRVARLVALGEADDLLSQVEAAAEAAVEADVVFRDALAAAVAEESEVRLAAWEAAEAAAEAAVEAEVEAWDEAWAAFAAAIAAARGNRINAEKAQTASLAAVRAAAWAEARAVEADAVMTDAWSAEEMEYMRSQRALAAAAWWTAVCTANSEQQPILDDLERLLGV